MTALRVAVVAACPFPYPRGTPVRAARLSESLARLGHEVHVATYHVGQEEVDPLLRVWRIRGPGRIRPLEPGPSLAKLAILDPLLLATFRRMLARHGPFDVIHAHHYEGLLLALAARRGRFSGVPVIYDAHTLLETELPSYRGLAPRLLLRTCGRIMDGYLPRRADHVVAASDVLRDRLIASLAVDPDHVTTIGNGVERAAFVEPSDGAGPPGDGGIIVYAGNLADYHRPDLLLEAFAAILRIRSNATLRIYTDSPTEPVRQRARVLGIDTRVEIGSVAFPHLSEALAAADVAVNPRPVCEGVPQKNLNYMAAGLPLAAFPGSLHPYVDGETGVAAATVDGAGLAGAILRLLDRPRHAARLGLTAQTQARETFTWAAAARRAEEVFRRSIEARRRRVPQPVPAISRSERSPPPPHR